MLQVDVSEELLGTELGMLKIGFHNIVRATDFRVLANCSEESKLSSLEPLLLLNHRIML